jgi:hypothetical protein
MVIRARDPSPVVLRLMNTPERDTLSPRERAVHNDCFEPSPWGEGGESSEPGEGFLGFLTSSFVFIDILALFPRFWCSANRHVCGSQLAPVEKPQTAEPAVCATRLLDSFDSSTS